MAKTKYVSDGYIEEVTNRIYNDIPITDYVIGPEIDKDKHKDKIKQILKPGEKYVYLKDIDPDYIITNYCRVINVEKIRQVAIKITSISVLAYVTSIKVPIQEIFKDNGWEFDTAKIAKLYKKYKWKRITYTDKVAHLK